MKLLCLVVVSVLLAGQATAQQERFRTETELVEVNVLVTNKNGEVVHGLTKDDFTILDEGKPQPVTNFSFIEIPFSNTGDVKLAMTIAESGVDVRAESLGRVYIMILDDLHTTSCASDLPECEVASAWFDVKKRAQLFVEQFFSDNDLMSIVYSSGIGGLGQDFTNDRGLLLKALGRFVGRRPNGDVEATLAERRANALKFFRVVNDLTAWSNENLPTQRKVVLLFSEGVEGLNQLPRSDRRAMVEPSINAQIMADNAAFASIMGDTKKNLRGANLSIVSIDARGLGAPNSGHQSLMMLSEETGENPILRTNDFARAFSRVVHEHSSHYLLGYVMPSGNKPGTTRKITIKVNGRGLEVRHRQGYIVPH
ncbi:MAG: VWA domain-containing protein [bacterium]|nr:VWA domain-containing protein [bacterium]